MEMNRLTREADELIRKVVARYNTLYSPSGIASQVELDLLLDDLRLMYEKFRIISQLNLQHIQQENRKVAMPPQPKPGEHPHFEEPVAASSEPSSEPEPAEQRGVAAGEEQAVEKTTNQTLSADEHQPSDIQSVKQPLPETPEVETQVTPIAGQPNQSNAIPTQDEQVQTIADKYKNSQKSLSETILAGSEEESVGSRLGHQTVSDLKSIIGLAEKFAFINELFGGDPLAYEKAIVQLNGATRLTEAEAYLGTLRLNYKWPAESAQAVILGDIIRRKFGV